jgi:hypothetical protein
LIFWNFFVQSFSEKSFFGWIGFVLDHFFGQGMLNYSGWSIFQSFLKFNVFFGPVALASQVLAEKSQRLQLSLKVILETNLNNFGATFNERSIIKSKLAWKPISLEECSQKRFSVTVFTTFNLKIMKNFWIEVDRAIKSFH